mmetsp:Transcript_13573/g.32385  ORF Transcript_13573/g.32385 Transcript_13573/m.32385 type:complete len:134 (-) Transcript_13573:17-418(-)
MAQRTSAAMALGGLAGGLLCLNSGSQQAFTAAPASSNLRQRAAQSAAEVGPSSSAPTGSSLAPAVACGGILAATSAVAGRGNRGRSTTLPTSVVQPVTARRALDQSSRYADLSLDEQTLIKNGKHVLVAYIMK